MTLVKPPEQKFRRYYASGTPFVVCNSNLIKEISEYALAQHDPQVTKEAMSVINIITQAKTGEDVLKFIIYSDINTELETFLIKTVTRLYN